MLQIADWLYPRHCPLCDRILTRQEPLLCRSCAAHLPMIRGAVCLRCGRPLPEEDGTGRAEEYCADCRKTPHLFVQGTAPYVYGGAVQSSVLRMKYGGRAEYARFYAASICQYGGRLLRRWQPDVIVPVPVHRSRYLKRGYNQAELLAEQLSAMTGIPVDEPVCRIRQTRPQKGLSPAARRKNVQGAFRLLEGAAPAERILLVDDIYTTGSTLDALAAVLLDGGARELMFACASVSLGTG